MTSEVSPLDVNEYNEIDSEIKKLEASHKSYLKLVTDMQDQQKRCTDLYNRLHKRNLVLRKRIIAEKAPRKNSTRELSPGRSNSVSSSDDKSSDKREISAPTNSTVSSVASSTLSIEAFKEQLKSQKERLDNFDRSLPKPNGLYLNIVLGRVNVSLFTSKEKFAYKQHYENFKLVVTMISLAFASTIYLLHLFGVLRPTPLGPDGWPLRSGMKLVGPHISRLVDALFHFLCVWYYCTLTIRESILLVNGSKIQQWWTLHHFVSTVAAGILLIWPDSASYQSFRTQFFVFSIYITLLQVLQYKYQTGMLYRMRALGLTSAMQTTIEGIQNQMWRGMVFLIPFLLIGYAFQAYNAWVLLCIAREPTCREWHVLVLAFIFFCLATGNTIALSSGVVWKIVAAVRGELRRTIGRRARAISIQTSSSGTSLAASRNASSHNLLPNATTASTAAADSTTTSGTVRRRRLPSSQSCSNIPGLQQSPTTEGPTPDQSIRVARTSQSDAAVETEASLSSDNKKLA